MFYKKEKDTLSNLSNKSPRKFWKHITKYKNTQSMKNNMPSFDSFVDHFKIVSNTSHQSTFSDEDIPGRTDNISIDMLDRPFNVEEISKTIGMLSRHKSADITKNVADFFIDSKDFIAPYLVDLFNVIYDTGVYPELWTQGLIVPIYKKGDRSDPKNYRGITLVNVLAKIFSLSLRNRINSWCENEHVFNESQFGFRDNHSTVDCIFLLHSIIQKVLLKKSKLYCIFVDYERAFDTIKHEALWVKLINLGISCKMLTMIKAIYVNVKSCVRDYRSMSKSEFFDVTLGVKQGEPLSPLLFILFINDIQETFNLDNLTDKDIELLSIYMLLFADDIAMFTTDPNSLQCLLDDVYNYSCKWGLKINVNKTKVCIFEKRKTKNNYIWTVNGEVIEIVDSFTYLGVKFHYTGSFKYAVKSLHDQAFKAYSCLVSLFCRVSLDIKTKLKLFDSLVVPIILYGCEVWGIYNFKEVDRLHLTFCKQLLGVKSQTSNAAVLGELGRYPLLLKCKERSLKYWSKVLSYTQSPMNAIFAGQLQYIDVRDAKTWAKAIKDQLDTLGYGYLFYLQSTDINCLPLLYKRLKDQFIQECNNSICNQPKLYYYRMFKKDFAREKYLDLLDNDFDRKSLSRLRLSSHSLEIETGRYLNTARNERLCKCCYQNVVESEYHFISCCSLYSELRRKYEINEPFPTLNKFSRVMSSKNIKTIRNISKYIRNAMLIRQEKLENLSAS